jgi:hypothetical protein
MKILLILSSLFILTISADKCGSKSSPESTRYKGKLETKGICMNYTLRLVEGSIDTSMVAASWTDETTNKTYKQAFALGNPCTFPATLKEGDEFYFVIDTSRQQQQCTVCLAYYPTPPRKLFIKVIEN